MPDEAVLAAAGRVFARVGPSRFTLADVANEAGLAAATVVQRFGSKRELMVAFADYAAALARRPFERARGMAASPVEAVRASILLASRGTKDRQELVNSLAFLLEDLADNELRSAAIKHAEWTEDCLFELLEEAVKKGDLNADDTRLLARTLQAAWNGAMVQWALRGKGSLEASIAATIDCVLEPRIVRHRGKPRSRRST